MFEGKAETSWRAVVEDVDAVFLWRSGDFSKEGGDGGGDRVKGVGVVGGNGCEAETWKIGRNDTIMRGEDGDEVAVLVRRGWEAVKEKDGGRGGETGFPIEDAFTRAKCKISGHCCEESHVGCIVSFFKTGVLGGKVIVEGNRADGKSSREMCLLNF